MTNDLDTFLEQVHLSLGEFTRGNSEPLKMLYSRRDDVTIANPFGPVARGWKKAAETMDRAATNYADGEATGFETVSKYVTPELAYTVEVERFNSKIGGSEGVTSFELRCTSVYRPEDGAWRIVHRHADPITTPRPAGSLIDK